MYCLKHNYGFEHCAENPRWLVLQLAPPPTTPPSPNSTSTFTTAANATVPTIHVATGDVFAATLGSGAAASTSSSSGVTLVITDDWSVLRGFIPVGPAGCPAVSLITTPIPPPPPPCNRSAPPCEATTPPAGPWAAAGHEAAACHHRHHHHHHHHHQRPTRVLNKLNQPVRQHYACRLRVCKRS